MSVPSGDRIKEKSMVQKPSVSRVHRNRRLLQVSLASCRGGRVQKARGSDLICLRIGAARSGFACPADCAARSSVLRLGPVPATTVPAANSWRTQSPGLHQIIPLTLIRQLCSHPVHAYQIVEVTCRWCNVWHTSRWERLTMLGSSR